MKHLPFILLDIAATLSLLLCLAAIWLWFSARPNVFEIVRTTPLARQSAAVSRGQLRLAFTERNWLAPRPDDALGWSCNTYYPNAELLAVATMVFPTAHPPVGGFFIGRAERYDYDLTMIFMPMSFVVPLLIILPIVAGVRHARRRRRTRRSQAGQCIACGYDLRATPDRCPECGLASPASATDH